MKFQFLHLATLLSLLTSSASAARYDNCTAFNWEPKESFVRYQPTPQRISAAITCPSRDNSTHGCALSASGDVQVSWSTRYNSTFNDTIPQLPSGLQLPTTYLHSLIVGATNYTDFNTSVLSSISQTVFLQPGRSGFLDFYPLEKCVTGTMTGCNGTIVDGFAVEACAPVYSVGGRNNAVRLDGRVAIQNVTATDVGNFPDPFANQWRGESSSAAGKSVKIAWGVFSAAVLGGVGVMLI